MQPLELQLRLLELESDIEIRLSFVRRNKDSERLEVLQNLKSLLAEAICLYNKMEIFILVSESVN